VVRRVSLVWTANVRRSGKNGGRSWRLSSDVDVEFVVTQGPSAACVECDVKSQEH
jgi:hypothetical protein